ncbi:MAG: hypothetical protein ACJASR_001498 [Psychroserpens sp.]|jgi:hypothetical protein
MEKRRRVVFYSINDLSSGHNLNIAESIINNFNPKGEFDINDIFELFHIKEFFDNDIYLKSWDEETKKQYNNIVNSFWDLIRKFWLEINNDNILDHFSKVEYNYSETFWHFVNRFNTYKNIESSKIGVITKSSRFNIRQLLKQKNLVNYYSSVIKEFLFSNSDSAEILLSHFEEDELSTSKTLHFPNKLSDADKEKIVKQYIELPNANLNFVRLAATSRGIKLSDKTKFKAKKLADILNKEILEKGSTWKQGVQVAISKNQAEPILVSFDNENIVLNHTYSEKYLLETNNSIRILLNFQFLFGFLNNQGCISLVSKKSETDSLESLLMRSKNDYVNYPAFIQKSLLSQAQLVIYDDFLKRNDILLEDALAYNVNEHLNEIYDIHGLRIRFASNSASYIEKIRMLAPEFEYLMKQYKSFSEDGFINFELLEFSSSPLNLSQVKSKIEKKYVYGQGNEFLRVKYDLFSEQSMLGYIEPFKDKYSTLSQLLSEEEIKYDDFEVYNKAEIDFLIAQDYIFIDVDNIIKFRNQDIIFIIGLLHKEEVINFWHFPINVRNQVIILEQKGLVYFEDTLFTIDERKYLNYYLNQKEFSNGLDLRNKYLHGTNSSSENEQKKDYYILLKILILVILKIRNDLSIDTALKKTGANNA